MLIEKPLIDIPILKDVFPPIFLRLTPAAVLKSIIPVEKSSEKYF